MAKNTKKVKKKNVVVESDGLAFIQASQQYYCFYYQ